MITKTLIIHPCFTRTGTTSFQDFLKSLDVNIIAKPVENQTNTIWFKLFKHDYFQSTNIYQKKEIYDKDKLKKDFKDYLKKFFSNEKKNSIFSDEGFFGDLKNMNGINNLYTFKKILKEVEEELNIKVITKFIITIRAQYDLVVSTYHIDQNYHKFMTFDEFCSKIIQYEEYQNLFDFTLIVEKIIKIFNSEILVLPLELLTNNKKKYVDKLTNFLSLEAAHSYNFPYLNRNKITKNKKNIYYLRYISLSKIFILASIIHNWLKKFQIYKKNFRNNTYLKIIYNFLKPKDKKIVSNNFENTYEKQIKKLYKNKNLKLEKITNINLGEMNYY